MLRGYRVRDLAFTVAFIAVSFIGILGLEELKKQYPHPRDSAQYAANEQAKPAPKQSRRTEDMKRLLDFIGKAGRDDWTLTRCWKAAQANPATRRG